MNTEDRKTRKILWWNMPVKPDEASGVGGGMMKAVVLWFVVVLAVVIVGVVIAALV